MKIFKIFLALYILHCTFYIALAQDSTVTSFTKATSIDSAGAFYIVQGAADRHVVWDQMVDAFEDSLKKGIITNAMVSPGAAIALTKLAHGTSAHIIVNNGSGVPTYVAMSGDVTISNTGATTIANNAIGSAEITDGSVTGSDIASETITSSNITNGTIADADISASASISLSKLIYGTPGQIIVGNGAGAPTYMSLSGDIASVSGTGAVDLTDNLTDNFTFSGALTLSGANTFSNTNTFTNTVNLGNSHFNNAAYLDATYYPISAGGSQTWSAQYRSFIVTYDDAFGTALITDFTNESDGQLLTVINRIDGTFGVAIDNNVATIVTKSGSDITLNPGDSAEFISYNGIWYER